MFAYLKEWILGLFGKDDSVNSGMGGGYGWLSKLLVTSLAVLLLVVVGLGIYWSFEPAPFSIAGNLEQKLVATGGSRTTGSASAATLIRVAETLLYKPGGYLTNDVMPPGIYLDNIPSWEFGVLVQVRDFSRAFRESFSRSQSQSQEDMDLREAEPLFSFDNQSWMLPASESEYGRALQLLHSYLDRISDVQSGDAQFFARADNLAGWLMTVESRLGSLSCRLSACIGEDRLMDFSANDYAVPMGQSVARAAGHPATPWLLVDNIFSEARGTTLGGCTFFVRYRLTSPMSWTTKMPWPALTRSSGIWSSVSEGFFQSFLTVPDSAFSPIIR